MLCFENRGELDPRLIWTIGVNAKPASDSPIGYFGTGLKYAIATTLRLGGRIIIQSGEAEFSFAAKPVEIRGQIFNLISMHGVGPALELAFTTDLGKNWLPWMVYRELYCNALDEGAEQPVSIRQAKPKATIGLTRVLLEGPEFLSAHEHRDKFILASKPLHTLEDIELHPAQPLNPVIFYRGIAVAKLSKPAKYAYNILSPLTLTEDRSAHSWEVNAKIALVLERCSNEEILGTVLGCGDAWFENTLDFSSWFSYGHTEIFVAIAKAKLEASPLTIQPSIRTKYAPPAAEVCVTCGRPL